MEAPFPSGEHRACLSKRLKDSKGSLKDFTDLELWHWHAYDYAFRRIFLGIHDARSTIDPEGRWFDSRVVEEAERWLRGKHKMHAPKRWPAPAQPHEIRDDCHKIPRNQLTEAEMEFLGPGFIAMMKRARDNLIAAELKWREAFRGPRSTNYVGEVEAPERALADVTVNDPSLLEQARARVGL